MEANEIMEVDDVLRLQDEYRMQRNAVKELVRELINTKEGCEIFDKILSESSEKTKAYFETIIYDITFF